MFEAVQLESNCVLHLYLAPLSEVPPTFLLDSEVPKCQCHSEAVNLPIQGAELFAGGL